VKLAKINIDENPELAQALRVQSVPTVYAFFGGRPVSAFQGVRPQSEIQSLIDQLVKMAQQAQPDALDIPAVLATAAQALAANDLDTAHDLYAAIMAQDETNAQAYAGLVRTFISAGETGQAQQLVEHAPPQITASPHFASAKTALEIAQTASAGADTSALEGAVRKNPADHQARFDLAMALFSAGKKEEAMDALIEIIRRNRSWEEDKARQQLLKFFDALGPTDPLTVAGRRKLSSVLFS
jgi:putative thioredoxin